MKVLKSKDASNDDLPNVINKATEYPCEIADVSDNIDHLYGKYMQKHPKMKFGKDRAKSKLRF
jgi:hypothetical protein